MNILTISGNSRFRILQDYNNDLLNKKYIKINKRGNIEIRIFNEDNFDPYDMQKYYSIYYNNKKPYIGTTYNINDFIPYYIIYPNLQKNKSNDDLYNECNKILKKIKKNNNSITGYEYINKILFDDVEFKQNCNNNESYMNTIYNSHNKSINKYEFLNQINDLKHISYFINNYRSSCYDKNLQYSYNYYNSNTYNCCNFNSYLNSDSDIDYDSELDLFLDIDSNSDIE